ncbi:uncharacterized protein ACLA_063350 [Aspergillus clavatus NRRL 1]|uniref:Uncharacterized protein n=1 Tax=Aspergillus clavatus (strain ATCC 1007 / CBS 513.65 / DSM 816 / NCTC 3887 / NRRL 1 / QM 1276 / 107) TaxID=344612 RepID=A1CCW1_ASPCL|nr:uncharacterized protein ACLA_063350 [Aspergillus clavatus NRRL 1]EAW12368.1 conserved hypothetical protein [Aspergillus clavatus NRRL 1]
MNPLRYLAPPRPFTGISSSTTSEELEERINFADSIRLHLRLNAPESCYRSLQAYTKACQTLMERPSAAQNTQARESAVAEINNFEKSIESKGPARLCFDLATKTKMGEELDNLHDMWAFARYEKYLPASVKEDAPSHPSAKAADPWHKAFWKPFNGRLEAEAEAFNKVIFGQNAFSECPTYLLLALLCDQHTVDWDETLELIQYCGREGAELPKADFTDYLTARDVAGLATRLDRDENSISLSTEYVMGVGTMLLAYFRMHLPEALFEVDGADVTEWKPKQRLLDLMALQDGHEQAMRDLIRDMFYEMVLGGSDDEEEGEFDDDVDMDDENALEDFRNLGIRG